MCFATCESSVDTYRMAAVESGEAIKVAVRVRKLPEKENNPANQCWSADTTSTIVASDGSRKYKFDRVFGPEEDNRVIYRDMAFDIIESAMKGFNSTIFAYGQTASGTVSNCNFRSDHWL